MKYLNKEDLMADLFYLRKDTGFTPQRVPVASVFIEVAGGHEQSFEMLKTRLLSALNTLTSKEDVAMLKAAFALLPEYETLPLLKERREKYGKQIKRKIDTIASRENVAIRELALQLLSNRYTLSPVPENVQMMHNAAIHERIEITTLVRDKIWVETRENYQLISLMNDISYMEIGSDIAADIVSMCDCRVVSRVTGDGSGRLHQFMYPKPLNRGDSIELSFVMLPDKALKNPIGLIEETRAFHEPTLYARFEVIFLGQKPRLIWQYQKLTLYQRPGRPKRQQLLDFDGGSVVATEFTDLYGGLFSGVAWEW